MAIWVVMRCHNDMPFLADTLEALARQTEKVRLLALDNASSDGGRELLAGAAEKLIDIPEGAYVPGRVLNLGMAESNGEVTAFLNADCTPTHSDWLARLIEPMKHNQVAATFGRQDPRPDCPALLVKDTVMTYGDGVNQSHWRHCFSMAASAIRRQVWKEMPFDESLGYSEDIDWTWRARKQGHLVRYVANAAALHSNSYGLAGHWRRQYGEGRAEAVIFDWDKWQGSFFRYSLLPFVRQVAGDLPWCARRGLWQGVVASPLWRLTQMIARRRGFTNGRRERRGTA